MKRSSKVWLTGFAIIALGIFVPRVEAQQNSYYGYNGAGGQLATLAAQASMGQTPPGCAGMPSGCVVMYGCQITVTCPPTPYTCPPYGGGTADVCKFLCDQPPYNPNPITLTIYKNYYVPFYVKNNTPPNVQAVNFDVKYREIHYLSDEYGNAIDKDGKPLLNPDGVIPKPGTPISNYAPAPAMPSRQSAALPSPSSPGSMVSAPAEAPTAPVSMATATPTPSTPVAAQAVPAAATAKQWVWLRKEGVYGFGYQRTDGLWVIDEGSRQASKPIAGTTPEPASTVTASN